MMVIAEMNGAIVRHSILLDVCELSASMREKDCREIWRVSHATPEEALLRGYLNSSPCLTLQYDEDILAMCGVTKNNPRSGCVWLLGSDHIKKIPKTFVKLSKLIIGQFLIFYPYLWNYVDAEYSEALKWLEICGANIQHTQPWGIEGREFCYITFNSMRGQ